MGQQVGLYGYCSPDCRELCAGFVLRIFLPSYFDVGVFVLGEFLIVTFMDVFHLVS